MPKRRMRPPEPVTPAPRSARRRQSPAPPLPPRVPPRARGDRGFTLLETLVAFAIAAGALAVLFQAIGGSLRAVDHAALVEGAVVRARSHLAAAGTDLSGLSAQGTQVSTGSDGTRYRWRVEIAPGRDATLRRTADLVARLRLTRVTATETWREAGSERSVRLATDLLSVR